METTLGEFLKTSFDRFLASRGYSEKVKGKMREAVSDFSDALERGIVLAHFATKNHGVIISRRELCKTLAEIGIDPAFVEKHIDTLIKIEAINFKDISVITQRKFMMECQDLMSQWYEQSKGNVKPFYKEVRHDYFDTDNNCWVIDAWRTPGDNEQGVAPIEVYLNGSLKIREKNAFGFAICDLTIIEAIEETLEQIKLNNKG